MKFGCSQSQFLEDTIWFENTMERPRRTRLFELALKDVKRSAESSQSVSLIPPCQNEDVTPKLKTSSISQEVLQLDKDLLINDDITLKEQNKCFSGNDSRYAGKNNFISDHQNSAVINKIDDSSNYGLPIYFNNIPELNTSDTNSFFDQFSGSMIPPPYCNKTLSESMVNEQKVDRISLATLPDNAQCRGDVSASDLCTYQSVVKDERNDNQCITSVHLSDIEDLSTHDSEFSSLELYFNNPNLKTSFTSINNTSENTSINKHFDCFNSLFENKSTTEEKHTDSSLHRHFDCSSLFSENNAITEENRADLSLADNISENTSRLNRHFDYFNSFFENNARPDKKHTDSLEDVTSGKIYPLSRHCDCLNSLFEDNVKTEENHVCSSLADNSGNISPLNRHIDYFNSFFKTTEEKCPGSSVDSIYSGLGSSIKSSNNFDSNKPTHSFSIDSGLGSSSEDCPCDFQNELALHQVNLNTTDSHSDISVCKLERLTLLPPPGFQDITALSEKLSLNQNDSYGEYERLRIDNLIDDLIQH